MYHVPFFRSGHMQILGPYGYYVFLVLYLIAIWGVQVGTLVDKTRLSWILDFSSWFSG